MKIIFLLAITLSFNASAGDKLCAVEGISDSPQSMVCDFSEKRVVLSCMGGKYFLGAEVVISTWHEDVEEGNSPLVFKTSDSILKMTQQTRGLVYDATLEDSSSLNGTCR